LTIGDFTGVIHHQIWRLGSKNVLDDMVIAIDPGDIRKKYAGKMGGLCKIHDGSEHEIGERYWLAKAVAAGMDHKRVYREAYSQDAGGFISENEHLLRVIDTVGAAIGNKGIYAIDRGGSTISFWRRRSDSSSVSPNGETSSIKD
jgi:hypothetical protein